VERDRIGLEIAMKTETNSSLNFEDAFTDFFLTWTNEMAGLDVATCGVANAIRFSPLATNVWRMVASLATRIVIILFL